MNNGFNYKKYYAENILKGNMEVECIKKDISNEEYIKGLVFDISGSEMKDNICIYVDRVFDGKVCISGGLSDSLSIVTTTTVVQNIPAYITKSQFVNCKDGCNLRIGAGAEFFIENTKSEVINLSVDTIPNSNVLLEGIPPASIQPTEDNKYSMFLNNSVPFIPPECDNKNIGKNISVVFNNISNFRYIARHTLHGKVKYNGIWGKFCISAINNSAVASGALFPSTSTVPNRVSFVIPELAVPSKNSKIQFYFKGNCKLVNPLLTIRAVTSSSNEVVLTSNLVIIPKVIVEVIEKTRILIPAKVL